MQVCAHHACGDTICFSPPMNVSTWSEPPSPLLKVLVLSGNIPILVHFPSEMQYAAPSPPVTRFEERITAVQTLLSQKIEVWNTHFILSWNVCDSMGSPPPSQRGLMLPLATGTNASPLWHRYGSNLEADYRLIWKITLQFFRGFGF